jgi:hypothetical protein
MGVVVTVVELSGQLNTLSDEGPVRLAIYMVVVAPVTGAIEK